MISAISPVDGRYTLKTKELQQYFSEFALIKYRVEVEIKYLVSLDKLNLKNFKRLTDVAKSDILRLIDSFDQVEAQKVKAIEKTTNHDVKAVEYYLAEKFQKMGYAEYRELIHFALTSQDINNTAFPLMIKNALHNEILPLLNRLISKLKSMSENWRAVPMLSHTHGQAASPTLVGKEFMVFTSRIDDQLILLNSIPIKAKFGGAVGNFNAHVVAYPHINWKVFADQFIRSFGLERIQITTQIDPYDHLAALLHNMSRINTILIDLARDIWAYISMDYFGQKTQEDEVGSSTMPHKVNPIDFENAEGNLGMANAIYNHLAAKLPVSRLQRDLTDSTVIRNIGVPFAHSVIAWKSLLKGLDKLILNEKRISEDLDANWAVVTEALQTVLRREKYPNAYETLKTLTRGSNHITKTDIHKFIDSLKLSQEIKDELKAISPHNYLGYL